MFVEGWEGVESYTGKRIPKKKIRGSGSDHYISQSAGQTLRN